MSRATMVKFLLRAFVLGIATWCLAGHVLGVEPGYTLAWTRQIGTSSSDQGMSVAVDPSGNVFLGGITSGSLGGANAGYQDFFMSKCDSAGNVLWSRQIGGPGADQAYTVAVDASGKPYLAGQAPCGIGSVCYGGTDGAVIKYDTLGNQTWINRYGTYGMECCYFMAVDASGNAFTTGSTDGNLAGTNAGSDDAYVVKINASGSQLWAKQFGTSSADRGNAVTLDATGNIYLAGYTGGNIGGTPAGAGDAFLVKLNASGNQLWAAQLGSSDYDESYAVAIDSVGNVYMGGTTFGALPGCSSAGSRDAFLAKYNSSGSLLWKKQLGTSSTDVIESMAINAAGNLFVGGYTGGNLVGSPIGGSDAFLIEYDPSGSVLWSSQFGTASNDQCRSVTLDAAGNLYCGGYTAGSFGGTNAGSDDAFAAKFLAPVPEPSAFAFLMTAVVSLLVFTRRWREERPFVNG
jgi:hypothetical protein